MITAADIDRLPEPIKKEILDYAEYLSNRIKKGKKTGKKLKWHNPISRGPSIEVTATDTVVQMRDEEKW